MLETYIRKCIEYRAIEEAIAFQYKNQKMRCPVHLSIGQEYWLPFLKKNIFSALRCYSSHRSHSMYLALDGNIQAMIDEFYGLDSGCLKGKGGSMHLKDLNAGLEASIPIVGSSLPLALGSAFSAKHAGKELVSVAYFGDGACQEGVLHECLNFASTHDLPILFLCENNRYSCNTVLNKRQPTDNMCRFAEAAQIDQYDIIPEDSFELIDEKFKEIVKKAYSKPIFVQVNSYRLYERCGHKIDRETGDRTVKEFNLFKDRDPVSRLLARNNEYKDLYSKTYTSIISYCEHLEASL